VEDFQKALENYQLNQHKIVYMQQQQTKLNNQIKISRGLDNIRNKMEFFENKPKSSYDLLLNNHQSFTTRPHQFDSGYQTPFFNSGSLIDYK
jgi:hypothetical protein